MRKFLDDISIDPHYGTDDDEQYYDMRKGWAIEQLVYGFDERDVWSVSDTMVALLYERLKMFEIVADNSAGIDLDEKLPPVDDIYLSYREWINVFCNLAEYILQYEFNQKPVKEMMNDRFISLCENISLQLVQGQGDEKYIDPDHVRDRLWYFWYKIGNYFWH